MGINGFNKKDYSVLEMSIPLKWLTTGELRYIYFKILLTVQYGL